MFTSTRVLKMMYVSKKCDVTKCCKYTLIELLVSIAIISILLTITLPALNKAKQMTYRAVCMNNLKQFGMTFGMYTDDYNGFWPPYCESVTTTTIDSKWLWIVYLGKGKHKGVWKKIESAEEETTNSATGFGKLEDIYQCPADNTPTLVDFVDLDKETEIEDFPMSYSYNLMLFTENIPTHRLKDPSDIVTLFDADDMVQMQGVWVADPDFYTQVLAERHKNGANHLFADFHVEWKPIISPDNIVPTQ